MDSTDASNRPKRKKIIIIFVILGLVAAYIMGALVYVAVFRLVPEPVLSATTSRDTPQKRRESPGFLEASDRDDLDGYDTATEWANPIVVNGDGDGDMLLEWAEEKETPTEAKITERWAEGLSDGKNLELVAFATWHPQPGDDVDPETELIVDVNFRDAQSTELIESEQLNTMGIPEDFLTMHAPRRYQTPKMRLLFRSEGNEHLRIIKITGGDANTGAEVTYSAGNLDDAEPETGTVDGWTYFDLVLVTWHDLPMDFIVEVLAGEPEIQDLPSKAGDQLLFGNDSLRLQFLGQVDGRISVDSNTSMFEPSADLPAAERDAIRERLEEVNPWGSPRPFGRASTPPSETKEVVKMGETAWIKPRIGDDEPAQMLFRTSSSRYLSGHLGLLLKSGETIWDWDTDSSNELFFAGFDLDLMDGGGARLIFLPQVTEVEFSIARLPDVPNQVIPENLMNLQIPRLTVPTDPSDAETHLLSYIGATTQAAWKTTNRWTDNDYPDDLPADRTFRDTTPQELLKWYMRATPGSTLEFDDTELQFVFNAEKETWVTALFEKMKSFLPFL